MEGETMAFAPLKGLSCQRVIVVEYRGEEAVVVAVAL